MFGDFALFCAGSGTRLVLVVLYSFRGFKPVARNMFHVFINGNCACLVDYPVVAQSLLELGFNPILREKKPGRSCLRSLSRDIFTSRVEGNPPGCLGILLYSVPASGRDWFLQLRLELIKIKR